MDDAFATKKKKGNHAQQSIEQSQSSVKTLCVLLVELPSSPVIMSLPKPKEQWKQRISTR